MKIRTDFVTNSSSSSFMMVEIDNPVLFEILNKYKEMGAFDNSEILKNDVGKYGEAICIDKKDESDFGSEYMPTSIDEIVEALLSALEYEHVPAEYISKIKMDFEARKTEINDSYRRVEWFRYTDGYGEAMEYLIDKLDDEELEKTNGYIRWEGISVRDGKLSEYDDDYETL